MPMPAARRKPRTALSLTATLAIVSTVAARRGGDDTVAPASQAQGDRRAAARLRQTSVALQSGARNLFSPAPPANGFQVCVKTIAAAAAGSL